MSMRTTNRNLRAALRFARQHPELACDDEDEDWWCLMCGDWTDAPCGRCGRCGELAIERRRNDDGLTWWCEECGDVTEEPCGVCLACQNEEDR